MSLDTDTATQAVSAYFGPAVLHDEPTWVSVLVDEATSSFDSAEDLQSALDLMNLGVEVHAENA